MTLASLLLSLLLILAVIGSLAGLVLGAWLFLHPGAKELLDRSALEVIRVWYRPWRVERFVYRHHRWFGGGIVIGSFFTLMALGMYAQRIIVLQAGSGAGVAAWLWESVILFVVLGNFFTLAAGILITLRPSGLKGFESWSNQAVDGSRVRWVVKESLRRWPRLVAVVLVAGGAFSLFSLVRMLGGMQGVGAVFHW